MVTNDNSVRQTTNNNQRLGLKYLSLLAQIYPTTLEGRSSRRKLQSETKCGFQK
jgi:hypothetical protein